MKKHDLKSRVHVHIILCTKSTKKLLCRLRENGRKTGGGDEMVEV